jgi:hypothetical protein
MRLPIALAAGSLLLAAGLSAQQPQARPTPAPIPPIAIWRVDLNPSGSAFAVNEPVLEGDVWVFRSIPDRQVTRVKKERVKKVSRWTKDFDKEVVFLVDADPIGLVLSADEPVKKGNTYVFHAWKGGTYMSVRAADLRKITRLTGLDAWKVEQLALGVKVIDGEVTFNQDEIRKQAPAPQGGQAPGTPNQPGNWTYQGTPGASDAYAPASGSVARPGDTPMAPTPAPPPR